MEERSKTESRQSDIAKFVKRKLMSLQSNPNEAAVRAILAKMRRGVGEQPGAIPELWDMLFTDLPESLEGRGSKPSRAEWAIFTALTLFSLHQQGKRNLESEFMFQEKNTFGRAVAQLISRNSDDKEAIIKRFNVAVSTTDLTGFSWYLRSLIKLCKREDIPMDYAALAKDLYDYQNPDRIDGVRLKWGRDFYRELSSFEHSENDGATGMPETGSNE